MDASGERPETVTRPHYDHNYKGPLEAARHSAAQEQNDKPDARNGQTVDVRTHEVNLLDFPQAAVDPKYNLIVAQCRAHLSHEEYVYVRDNIQAEFKNSLRDTPDDINKCSLVELINEGVDGKMALFVRCACDPDDTQDPPYMIGEYQAALNRAQAHKLAETADDGIDNQNDKGSTKSPPSVTGTLYKVAQHCWQAAQQCWRTGGDQVNDKIKDE